MVEVESDHPYWLGDDMRKIDAWLASIYDRHPGARHCPVCSATSWKVVPRIEITHADESVSTGSSRAPGTPWVIQLCCECGFARFFGARRVLGQDLRRYALPP